MIDNALNASGDCFSASFDYMMDICLFDEKAPYKLVHAEVAGRGPLEGITFAHAFLLHRDNVIDPSNGRLVTMPKELYYALGGITRINNIYVYSWIKAKKLLLKHQHYGPWDLKTATGL